MIVVLVFLYVLLGESIVGEWFEEGVRVRFWLFFFVIVKKIGCVVDVVLCVFLLMEVGFFELDC